MLTQERVFTYEPSASTKSTPTCIDLTKIDPNQAFDSLKDTMENAAQNAAHEARAALAIDTTCNTGGTDLQDTDTTTVTNATS